MLEQSELPKGIVDLHLYTNFTIEGENDNILKLSIGLFLFNNLI